MTSTYDTLICISKRSKTKQTTTKTKEKDKPTKKVSELDECEYAYVSELHLF